VDIAQFDLHAQLEDKHWWFTGRRAVLLEILNRFLPTGMGHRIAEIGCGTGGNLSFFQDFYDVMGVDISHEAISHARQRVDCPLFLGDFGEQLAPYWPKIDALLLLDVLEHVEDDRAFLGRAVEALRPGGLILLTVPAYSFLWSHHDEVLGHVRRYEMQNLRNVWSNLQVEECYLSPFNSFLFPIIAFCRLMGFGNKGGRDSNLKESSSIVNFLLHTLFASERFWLKLAPLPVGVSYCAVLKKH